MGVDAKAVLTSNPPPIDIMNFLNGLDCVSNVYISPTTMDGFIWLNFCWKGEARHMSVFFNNLCMTDYEDITPLPSAYCSIGAWGFSDAIIVKLTKHFGGFYTLNDCKDEWTQINPA